MRRLQLLSLLTLCLGSSFVVEAQVRGRILEQGSSKPVERAMVQSVSSGKIIDYGMSDAGGYFYLPKAKAPCELRVRHLSYERLTVKVSSSAELSLYLKPKTTEIKSLVIEAPVVRQRGDTTTYQVSSYAGKADVSIEDAMKRMPGVKVDERGKISYLGKAVDKLTIDGLNLTGANYTQATRSVRHKDVARLEVMERQQEVQHLKGIVGDDKLIMNIVLRPSGRNRIRGKAELGAGVSSSRPVYGGSTTAMRFNPKAQQIATLEVGQDYFYPKYSVIFEPTVGAHAGMLKELYSSPSRAIRTGLSERIHLRQRDLKTSLNAINKLSPTATLRYGLGTKYHLEETLHGSDTRFIVPGAREVEVSESSIASAARPETYSLWSEYLDNGSKGLVQAKLSYDYDLGRYTRGISIGNGQSLSEDHRQRTHSLNGLFKIGRSHGQTLWDLSVSTKLSASPDRELALTGSQLRQSLSAREASANVSGQLRRRLNLRWRLDLPLSYDAVLSRIHLLSSLATPKTLEAYYTAKSGAAGFRPQLSYQSKGQDYRLDLGTGLSWRHGVYALPQGEHRYGYLLGTPFVRASAKLSHSMQLDADVRATQTRGSFADHILEPIYSSYRAGRRGSGQDPKSFNFSSNLSISYRKPIQEFYAHLHLGYSMRQSYMILSDAPEANGKNIVTHILGDSRVRGLSASADISKFFRPIKAKVDLGVRWSRSEGELNRYQRLSRYDNSSSSISLSLAMEPLSWLDLSYKVQGNLSILHYEGGGLGHKLRDLRQTASLTLLPLEHLKLSVSLEHLLRETAPGQFASLAPLGLSAEYKLDNNVLGLEADNLFNYQRYSYSVFDGLQVRASWYQLRGRILRVSYSFYF